MMPPDWRPPTLTTRRLVLRAFEERDIEPLFAHASNPNVTKYTLWDAHRTFADSRMFVCDYAMSRYREGTPEPYAITFRGDPADHPIGAIGCFWVSQPCFTMELGYWLAEPFWGQGLVTEAIPPMLAHAFDVCGAERIQAKVIEGNDASRRVLEKSGFQFEGTLRLSLFRRGKFENVLLFARLRGDV
jgi:ribosomal-protein-alanine N-acetyltransferase